MLTPELQQRLARGALAAAAILFCYYPATAGATAADIQACRGIDENAKRLSCYDSIQIPAAPEASTAQSASAPAPTVSNAPPRPPVKRQHQPPMEPATQRPPPRQKPPDRGSADLTGASIEQIIETVTGRHRFRLDNGELWEQTEPRRTLLKVGDRVDVTESFLGSWTMRESSGSSRSFKVRRIE